MSNQNPATVIATRSRLISDISSIYAVTPGGEEAAAIIDHLIGADFISDEAFDKLGVTE